jgi:predicted unusual protein kinase regulating ubiquinone biosynthesis (AarF/ABC1/UbiB family)
MKIGIEKSVLYVKIAQNASLMYDVIDEEVIEELKTLHSNVKTEKIEFNIPNVIYDLEPIASGSIAQIYKGVYKDKDVAIKVIRPSVLKQIITLQRIKYGLNKIGNIYKYLKSIVQRCIMFIDNILLQTNCNEEVNNMEFFREILQDKVIIPKVYKELSTDQYFVMEYIHDKISIYDVTNKEEVIDAILDVASKMIYEIGTIHNDMHPGNIYWNDKENKVVLFDFGIVFTFNEYVKSKLTEMNINFILGRIENVARNHLEITLKNFDELKDDEYCNSVLNAIVKLLKSNKPSLIFLKNLSKVDSKFRTNFSVVNEHTINYELFINHISQIIRLLNPECNFFNLILKKSFNLTLQNLGKTEQYITNDNPEIFISI